MKRWSIKPAPVNTDNITDGSLVSYVRALRDIDEADASIADPMLIRDMDRAVGVIKAALCAGEKIIVFGDYDCDGVTGTVMLYQYLQSQGGEVDWFIPAREDGYGLSIAAVDVLIQRGVQLIITVDNGISSIAEAAYIKENGIKLIITDHHTVTDGLPVADAVVNPKRPDCPSLFKDLAGCGVALKLIMAIEDDIDGVLEQFSDLAALGTIGDVVPVLGENRVIIKAGLRMMPHTENIGLYKLLRHSGFLSDDYDNSGGLTANALSFTACPRINAAGRFDHAGKAVELLLCEEEALANIKSHELTKLNNNRREVEGEITRQAEAYFADNPHKLSERVLILKGETWHSGVIGIVGSRLLGKYGKPVIVMSDDGEFIRGSARSVDDFPLIPMLEECRDLMEKFGGHVKAAGFTVRSEHFDKLTERIRGYAAREFAEMPADVLNADKILTCADMTHDNVEGLTALSPFGEGNPVPLFMLRDCVIVSKKPLKDGKFITFNVRISEGENSVVQKILNFSGTYEDFGFEIGEHVDIVVTLSINEYNNIKSISAQMKDIRPCGFNQDRHFAALRAYEGLIRGEAPDMKLAARVLPDKSEIKFVYDIIRCGKERKLNRVYAEAAASAGVNFCKFRVIIDVLSELTLVEHDIMSGNLNQLPVSGKADLDSSRVLKGIRKLIGGEVRV